VPPILRMNFFRISFAYVLVANNKARSDATSQVKLTRSGGFGLASQTSVFQVVAIHLNCLPFSNMMNNEDNLNYQTGHTVVVFNVVK